MLELYEMNNAAPVVNHLLANDLQLQNPSYSITQSESTKPFVLIVGKDKDTRFLFKTAFEIWNYDVAEAEDLNQSLSISAFKIPDLVLIDSEIDFQETLTMMSSLQKSPLFKDCGFIFISGHAQENVRKTALSAGANFFLVKPVDFGLLEKFLRIYLDRKSVV